jgi:hypothetical protein
LLPVSIGDRLVDCEVERLVDVLDGLPEEEVTSGDGDVDASDNTVDVGATEPSPCRLDVVGGVVVVSGVVPPELDGVLDDEVAVLLRSTTD